ncbi:uncharacterized protein LOC131029764 [Cryptomeria japonica]|uniref:uncharacterized protein LOC131029764 n=1 Tax=Cryptomeria japonica TaxID=3369 RepID=UPI0027D9D5A0|nr:uncharacterized protein LOC131029764 [Cryptomeria japonica]
MGASGGLDFLWKDMSIDLKLVVSAPFWMLALVRSSVSNVKLWLFNVYGPMSIGGKKALWDSLSLTLSPLHGQFVVFGGDLNAISSDDEKCGGILPNKRILEDFCAFILSNDLVDCKTLNGSFTWTNRRKYFSQIAERLDRFRVSDNWISSNVDVVALVFPYVGSDHFLVVLSMFDDRAPGRSSFKFEPMWFRDPSFSLLLQSWWSATPFVQGTRMFRFVKKLSYLKQEIKKWNVPHLKNIFTEKIKIQEELEALNARVMNYGMDSATFQRHKSLNSQLEEILSREEIYWRQKSRDLWLSDGDQNTKFFHTSAKMK